MVSSCRIQQDGGYLNPNLDKMIFLDTNNPANPNPQFCGNERKYSSSFFKSGEPHINALLHSALREERILIGLRHRNGSQLIELAMLVDSLKRQGFFNLELAIPYFPGGRQDRVCNEGEALSVKVYADFINNLGLKNVFIFDPHSEVTPALINNVRVIKNHGFVKSVLTPRATCAYKLISPDAGSNKKIYDLAKFLRGPEVVRCDKTRSVVDGKLSAPVVYSDSLEGEDCYIIDDICSRGGTFKALAKELKIKGARKVILVVSHYEGVADLTGLKEAGIDHIFCTNSICDVPSDNFITQYDIYSVMQNELRHP
jgi:ribose-phosphate pyrophosphokinase